MSQANKTMTGAGRLGWLSAMAPLLLWTQLGLVENPAERQVRAAEAARASARRSGDTAQIGALLAPDFVRVNRFGRLLGRAQTIRLARNPTYATDAVQVRLYDGGAVVTGRESDEGEPPGAVRFLRVWIDAGQWLEIAEEGTAVTSETAAAHIENTPDAPDRATIERSGSDANRLAEAAEAPADEAREVRAAERAYRDAERINDLTQLSRFRAPEFRLVNRLGEVLAGPTAGIPTIKAAEDEDFSVRVHRNIAVVLGSVTRSNLANGGLDRFRYTDVWVHHDRWTVVAEQRTPIAVWGR